MGAISPDLTASQAASSAVIPVFEEEQKSAVRISDRSASAAAQMAALCRSV